MVSAMTYSPTRRTLIAIGHILFVAATSLSVPLWPTLPASATIASPGSLTSTNAPTGLIINSPWVVDAAGTEWAYGTTGSSMGTLVSRNRTSGEFTSRAISAGDEGAIAGLYSPQTNMAVFSARRSGAGNRIITFDLTTGTRLATRTLAADENLIRALTFTSTGDSYTIGTNQNPAKVMKFTTTTGALEYSSTFGTGLKEITAFIPNGPEFLAAVNTTPIKLVAVTRHRLVVGTVYSLAAGTPPLMDPIVVGNTAYLGTDASPGRITAIDIPTKTVIGSTALNTGEIGARNLTFDESTGMLYVTTDSTSGPKLASFRISDMRRMGTTQLNPGSSITSLLLYGRTLAAGFDGTRGVDTFTVAPEPNTPVITSIRESDASLVVSWNSGGSVEPILDFTATASAGGSSRSCSSSGSTCTITGLSNGTSYAISVVARSAAGTSTAAVTSGSPRGVPVAPTISLVTRGNNSVSVTWTPRGDGGMPITGYRATASPSGQMCESIAPSCTITGMTNGIPQTVQVVARNSLGTSLPSTPSASVTPATTPSAPQIESARRSNGGAVISWRPPTSNGGDAVVSYLIRVTQGSNIVSESTTAHNSITVDGLTNGVRYGIVVSATNAVGTGGSADQAYVTPATVPDIPLAISTVRQDSGADVRWTVPPDNGGDAITGYRVHVRGGNHYASSYLATTSPYSIRGLENGTTYSVSVSAINSVGDGIESESSRVTPATVPVAPRSITALRRDQAAELSWNAPSNDGGDTIAGYRVNVRKGNESPVSFLVSESPYTVRGLTNGATYAVTVNAINSVGDSLASAPVVFTPATIPTPPSSISVQRRDSGADVSWTVPSNTGGDTITHYLVKVQAGNGHATSFTATESPISIRGLNNGATHSVTVSAINSVGESGDSEQVVFTPATIPAPPSSILVQRRDSGVDVSWTVPSNNGGDPITEYRVNLRDVNDDVTSFVTTESPFSIRGLANGTTYSVTVQSLNSVGDSVASESGVVTPATVPTEPLAVTVVRQNSGADVSWNAPLDNGGDPITEYRVSMRDVNDDVTSFVTTESPFSIRGLKNGTTYSVTITATNSVGNGIASDSSKVTPATIPDPPRGVLATRQDSSTTVSWSAPSDNGGDLVKGYRVRVWNEAVIVAEVETSRTITVVTGLNNGTAYRVTATSLNSIGDSIASESVVVTPATVPDAPFALTAVRQDSGADLSWTNPANDGGDRITSYRVLVRTGNERPTSIISTESSASIRGLENGAAYDVTVSAINSVGESVGSQSALVTPATIPDQPMTLSAIGVDGGAEVEWAESPFDGGDPITGYRIRVWREAVVLSEIDTSITNAYVPGLSNGTEYRVTVSSINSVGESVASTPAFVTPVPPPVVEPPIVDPPIVDPPIVDPPPTVRPPSAPVDVSVISASRKSITVGWRVNDSGGAPVTDFIVHTSRYKNRGFTVWPDGTSTTNRVELRKPRRGSLYVRVIAVTNAGESAPSQVKRVAR